MRILFFLLMSVLSAPVLAGNAQVAVAANFAQTLKQPVSYTHLTLPTKA